MHDKLPGETSERKFMDTKKRDFEMPDGARLNFLESGSGKPLLMLPGWSQTAAMYRHQFEGLSSRYRVMALDFRGHGESENVDFGYRISRLAMDLHEVIRQLGVDSLAVLGHSMGNAVLWSHWDLFGRDLFSEMIIAEQPPTLLNRPHWSQEEADRAGCITSADELLQNCQALFGDVSGDFSKDFLKGMFSSNISENDLEFITEQNLLMPREAAATLLQDTAMGDWRDLIPKIDIPTLIIAGRSSLVPLTSQKWIHENIAGSQMEIIEAEEGGSHFMFWEGFQRFNRAVASFLG